MRNPRIEWDLDEENPVATMAFIELCQPCVHALKAWYG